MATTSRSEEPTRGRTDSMTARTEGMVARTTPATATARQHPSRQPSSRGTSGRVPAAPVPAEMKVLTASAHRWLDVRTSDERQVSEAHRRGEDPERLPQPVRRYQRPATSDL